MAAHRSRGPEQNRSAIAMVLPVRLRQALTRLAPSTNQNSVNKPAN